MSVHDEHTQLPSYHPEQLLHDGCPECERRGRDVREAIGKLDSERFVRAWERAAQAQVNGLDNASSAERPMLDALAAVQIQLERYGWPLGIVPTTSRAPFNPFDID